MSAQPEWFRATCGRRRQFLSQSDADAYDDSYSGFPNHPPSFSAGWFGPAADGYHDADEDRAALDQAKAERSTR